MSGTYELSVESDVIENGKTIDRDSDNEVIYEADGVTPRQVDTYVAKATYTLKPVSIIAKNKSVQPYTWSNTSSSKLASKSKAEAKKVAVSAKLKVVATDYAGNSYEYYVGWDAQTPNTSGVVSKKSYKGTKTVTCSDDFLSSVELKSTNTDWDLPTFSITGLSKESLTIDGKVIKIEDLIEKKKLSNQTYTTSNFKLKVNITNSGYNVRITKKNSNALVGTVSNGKVSINLSNGIYNITAKDVLGNSKSVEKVRCDSAAPTISGFTNGKTYKNKTITVNLKDKISGLKSYKIDNEPIEYLSGEKTKTGVASISAPGYHRIVATDNAGNTATKTFIIRN